MEAGAEAEAEADDEEEEADAEAEQAEPEQPDAAAAAGEQPSSRFRLPETVTWAQKIFTVEIPYRKYVWVQVTFLGSESRAQVSSRRRSAARTPSACSGACGRSSTAGTPASFARR